jgi:short-subunit dehydrogenase
MNVVITGASKGIGRAIAEKFASAGADLFLCSRNMDMVTGWLQALMQKFNVSICTANADLSKKSEVIDFGNKILSVFESTYILINNAGLFEPGSVYNEDDGILEKMIEVNLYPAYHLTRVLLPAMIKRKSGHIFNICSIAALQAYHNGGSYSISKWALLGFSKNLREEMKSFGIKVTAVHPGATMTDSWAKAGIDQQRIMETRDIADMIYSASTLSHQACVEQIIIRPQLGDL